VTNKTLGEVVCDAVSAAEVACRYINLKPFGGGWYNRPCPLPDHADKDQSCFLPAGIWRCEGSSQGVAQEC